MNWYKKSIKLSVVVGLIVIMGVVAYMAWQPGLIVLMREGSKKDGTQKKIMAEGLSSKIMAEGLSLEEHFGNKKLLSIKLDVIKVVRKKAGFFSLGFFKIAKMENVRFDFYDYTGNEGVRKTAVQAKQEAEGPPIDFERGLACCNNLMLSKPRGIKGVEIDKIRVQVYRGDRLVSSLMSDRAKVDVKAKKIVFEGHVKMASGKDRLLKCSKMNWVRNSKRFRIPGPYVAWVKDRVIKGEGLEIGYLLTEL